MIKNKLFAALSATLRFFGIGNGGDRCTICGAWPGRACADPYCYGSLGNNDVEA